MRGHKIHSPEFLNELPRITRRHFFGASAAGLGGLALGSLLNGPLASAASNAAGRVRAGRIARWHALPAAAKRIIYLFQSGGPAQQDLFDYKPLLNEKNGEQLPASRPRRPAAHRHVGPAGVDSARRLGLQVRPARPVAAPGSASCCRITARSSTTCASSSRCSPRRSTTTRRSRSSKPVRRSPAGRRWAPGCPTAWAR